MRTVAVVGAGISGLSAAYFLSRRHHVHLFERDARLGGHTNTVVVDALDGPLPLDTGFIVHNRRTYPNLVRLFQEIGVATHESDMSFSVACRRTGFEYSSRGAHGFFAQRRNLLKPAHYRLFGDILRFNREARALLRTPDQGDPTVEEFVHTRAFGRGFTERFLLPMSSAIWSSSADAIRSFPARMLARFFDNHGWLHMTDQPLWRVVTGGSHTYIPKLTAPLAGRITCSAGIVSIRRGDRGVTITFRDRSEMVFDDVVFACHGDEVLSLLADPTEEERHVFSAFETTTNVAFLHTDASLLPRSRPARASWNYLLAAEADAPPTVTYDLNRLQGFSAPRRYCLTLNPHVPIDSAQVIGRFVYQHPLYTHAALRAHARWPDVSGVRRTHYCGAYWGYGFHEDGLKSALRVARAFEVAW